MPAGTTASVASVPAMTSRQRWTVPSPPQAKIELGALVERLPDALRRLPALRHLEPERLLDSVLRELAAELAEPAADGLARHARRPRPWSCALLAPLAVATATPTMRATKIATATARAAHEEAGESVRRVVHPAVHPGSGHEQRQADAERVRRVAPARVAEVRGEDEREARRTRRRWRRRGRTGSCAGSAGSRAGGRRDARAARGRRSRGTR